MRHLRYRREGQVVISMTIVITKKMLPSFRLIAYYHPNDNEVVSDSIWVDVQDSCMGSVRQVKRHVVKYLEKANNATTHKN